MDGGGGGGGGGGPSQTPSTGLRHPSSKEGGRCRKAMLGVWVLLTEVISGRSNSRGGGTNSIQACSGNGWRLVVV